MYLNREDITAVILAGGQGRRMGGQDKGLVTFRDQPLIRHVLSALEPQVDNIVINANRNHEQYAAYGYPVVADELTGFQGPLSGFLACLEAVDTDFILTLPCDGPFVYPDYVTGMLDQMNDAPCDILVASDGERMQPVYALIPTRLKQDLENFLSTGERKIDRWYASHDTRQRVFPADSGFFTNINTLEELQSSTG